jgi:hypothetical protein
MTRYVEVPREVLLTKLETAGFVKEDTSGEIVYSRIHNRCSDDVYSSFVVKIYTSISQNRDVARGCGKDAIRILGLKTWKYNSGDILRFKKIYMSRVYRVGTVDAVCDRTLGKAREAWRAISSYISEGRS